MSVVEAASPHLRDFLRLKDEDAGAGVTGRRREVAALVLDAQRSPLHSRAVPAPVASHRTLLDIIRGDEESSSGSYKRAAVGQGHHGKDRKSWKSFKDRIRLRRAGSAWVSTVPVPSADFPASSKTCRSPVSRQVSARFSSAGGAVVSDEMRLSENSVTMGDDIHIDHASSGSSPSSRPAVARRSSTRFGTLVPISIEPACSSSSPEWSLRPQISRHNSTRYTSESPRDALSRPDTSQVSRERDASGEPVEEPPRESTCRLSMVLAEERELSAREAAAAQEAAGATQEPVRMSLMDLLEETDRQMGLTGTRYTVGEEEDNGYAVEEEEEGADDGGVIKSGVTSGGAESNCCICMVRHKGAAFIPCGHTFCRLCSRELWVNRGNCPLCNNYIVEILDIF